MYAVLYNMYILYHIYITYVIYNICILYTYAYVVEVLMLEKQLSQ